MSDWAGRKVRRLVDAVLFTKGRTCHLCSLPGADSADHDPPRSVLVAGGVANPDALVYLFPSHRFPCNVARKARPITDELRAELRAKRLALAGPVVDAAARSPRFRRPDLLQSATDAGSNSFPLSPGVQRKPRNSE